MKTHNRTLIFSIILLLGELGAVASDIYIPSLPAISVALDTSSVFSKLTISIYLISFGLSQLIYGPLSDRYGRRKVALYGLIITAIASFGCTAVSSIEWLILFRFLQGLGAGSGTVMARAIMMDTYERSKLVKMSAFYSLISAQVLMLVPILGGYIQYFIGWRANFGFVLLYSIITLFIIYQYLPETNNRKIRKLKINRMINNYWTILTNKIFFSCVLCSSLALSSLIVYITIGPFLFQNVMGLTPVQYGYLSLVSCMAVVTGSLFNSQLISKIGILKMLSTGIFLMLLGGILLFLPAISGMLSLKLILIPVFIFMIGANLMFSCTAVLGLNRVRRLVGSAGALFGAIQMIISSLIGALSSTFGNTALPLAIVFLCAALSILYLFLKFIKPASRRCNLVHEHSNQHL